MPGKRRKPPEPVRPRHVPPRCLSAGVEEVWGGDGRGPERLRVARETWRAEAVRAGMTRGEAFAARPNSGEGWAFNPDTREERLQRARIVEGELTALAAEARRLYGWTFDPGWRRVRSGEPTWAHQQRP